MANLLEKLNSKKLTRRSFLKGTAALTALAFLKVSERNLMEVSGEEKETKTVVGEWKPAPCWHNCGGTCVLNAYVSDGKIIRLKTDDSHEDSYDFPQQRACARGLAQRTQVLGADRLKYPMKRAHFDPEGKTGKELRGVDSWVRISWDEALDLVASQLKKAKEKYGNESIYLLDGGEMKRTLALFGGYVSKYGSRSRGAWQKSMEPILGVNQKRHCLNDRMDLLNSKLIVLWGSNPAESAMGTPMLNLFRAKEKGVKFISIDPMYSKTAALLDAEYIPIRPATDTPLLLSLAYVLLKEDKDGSLIDWDFLNNCTIGFDAEHMPEGADPKDNFKDYVLGTYDNTPKSPEWASKICGVEVETIKKLAMTLGTTKPAAVLFSWNSARVEKAQHVCLAQMSLGAMTGNMGIKGGQFAVSSQECATNGGPALVKMGEDGLEEIKNPLKGPKLSTAEHWEAILTDKYTAGPGEKKPLNIRVMYHSHSSTLNQTNNTLKGIKAHRKVDFVVTNQYVLNPEATYSDVVLPVTTPWERAGEILQGNREMMIWTSKVIEPLFEAKDDMWIAKELGKRLGLDEKLIEPFDHNQRLFNVIASSTVVKEDGKEYENLVSVTEKDLKELKVEGKPQDGRIPILEYKKNGVYQVKRSEGDKFGYIHNKKFREDPVNNPLKTESGKIELYCKALADIVTKGGWNKGNPIAKYEPPTEGYEATFSDFEKGIKGKYPLQVFAIHGGRGTHTIFNQVAWLREAFPYEMIINPIDAKERNLKEKDPVRIFNDHGSVLRKVHLSERIMPGVVVMHEGTWVELDEDGNCIAGSPNVLTGDFPSGPDIESWNACIVQVEKYDKPLKDETEFGQRVVEI